MKKRVVVFLFNQDYSQCIMIKRFKQPFMNMYNGIGGHVKRGEDVTTCAKREIAEEVYLKVENPKLLLTVTYPANIENKQNHDLSLAVFYAAINQNDAYFTFNEEGQYFWMPTEFLLDGNNKQLAGYANISQFVKEILIREGLINFYEN